MSAFAACCDCRWAGGQAQRSRATARRIARRDRDVLQCLLFTVVPARARGQENGPREGCRGDGRPGSLGGDRRRRYRAQALVSERYILGARGAQLGARQQRRAVTNDPGLSRSPSCGLSHGGLASCAITCGGRQRRRSSAPYLACNLGQSAIWGNLSRCAALSVPFAKRRAPPFLGSSMHVT